MQAPPALLAGMAGVCFALIGVSYRLAAGQRIHELHILAVMSAVGVAVFGLRAISVCSDAPGLVIGVGIFGGITQYVTVYSIRAALKRGPLTAAWCAMMLGFIPVTLYAHLVFDETVTVWHYAALAAGTACVVMAATLVAPATEGPTTGRKTHPTVVFGLILLGLLLVNCVNLLSMKHLAMVRDESGASLMDRFGDLFRALLYMSILVCTGLDQAVIRRPVVSPVHAVKAGLLAGAGSVGGMWLLCSCASAAAGSVFVMSTATSILFTAGVGTLYFGEERTWRWYATVCLGILAALLSQSGLVRQILGRC